MNLLLDQSLESFVKLNNGIDTGASHRFENYAEVSSQLDWMIETH